MSSIYTSKNGKQYYKSKNGNLAILYEKIPAEDQKKRGRKPFLNEKQKLTYKVYNNITKNYLSIDFDTITPEMKNELTDILVVLQYELRNSKKKDIWKE